MHDARRWSTIEARDPQDYCWSYYHAVYEKRTRRPLETAVRELPEVSLLSTYKKCLCVFISKNNSTSNVYRIYCQF